MPRLSPAIPFFLSMSQNSANKKILGDDDKTTLLCIIMYNVQKYIIFFYQYLRREPSPRPASVPFFPPEGLLFTCTEDPEHGRGNKFLVS